MKTFFLDLEFMVLCFKNLIPFCIYFWDFNCKTLCIDMDMKDELSKFVRKPYNFRFLPTQQNQG